MKRLSRNSFRLSTKDPDKGAELGSPPSPPATMKDLQEFLAEADLAEYHSALVNKLKVTTCEHLKYVLEEDLEDIGMTRPEMRRLKKFYKKEFPQGTFNKLRKAILRGGGDAAASRTLSPSPPSQRAPRPVSSASTYVRPAGHQLIPLDAISLNKALGEGEFGVVQQAVWTTETGEKLQVAVKKLNRDRVNTDSDTFLREAMVLQILDHEHVARLYGVIHDDDDNLMLVTELAPMRSLLECLKDPALRVDLPLPRLCDYAQQVCDAMAYLESKRVEHRDLAARNVLVFSKNMVKVSDIGQSKLVGAGQDYYQSQSATTLKLPIAWCAPESINYLRFSSASDAWSFGVLLWEMFTYGFQPWAGLSGRQILEALEDHQRLEQPDLCTNELYELMKECWSEEPEHRPTFGSLLIRLPQLRPTQVKALKDYPHPTVEKGYISYKTGDIIVVIDKSPPTASMPGLVWRGVLGNGKSGLFDPTHVAPFIEPKVSPVNAKGNSLARKESSRKTGRKIRADMISRPQNDLRHTGHIGYDGAVFGDVSFIGDNYDKLPVKVEPGVGASRGSSMASIPRSTDSPDRNGHVQGSDEDLLRAGRNGYGQSWISRESLTSNTTYQSEGRASPSYLDMEDDSLFSDFKMPDLGSSFDFGPSFMDEVLKALDEKEKQVTSSGDTTPTSSKPPVDPPVVAPRSEMSVASVPPLPTQPPRVEQQKEKKQAKVKPMSASDEKMVDTAIARARELTSHMLSDMSPPVSPSQEEKTTFFEEESQSTGIISKLRNSMRRSTSPKGERKRTFSDEMESRGALEDEVPAAAQQAYNMLVVRGSVKESNSSSDKLEAGQKQKGVVPQRTSRTSSNASSSELENSSAFAEPDLIKDSKRASPPKVSAPINQPASPAPVAAPRPFISAPQPVAKPVGVAPANPAPVPAPRPVKAEPPPVPPSKKSEIPVPKPRPEIQRVEPTIRQPVPESPEMLAKTEKRIETHIPVAASRKEETKEREREELKRTIEIVRVDDSNSLKDDSLEKVSTSFDRSSARSSQRSSLDRSDNTSENAEEHSEYSSDSSKRDSAASSSVERKDSFTKGKQAGSLFEEDFSEPSPQEIMSKLRERRLNRHLDHQRALAGDGTDSASTVVTSRPRTAREPQGIPGRTPSVDLDEGAGGDGGEEVDTNPLRMLRGGAIPIRTGRTSAGRRIAKR